MPVVWQMWPHVPQLLGSVSLSTQVMPQRTAPAAASHTHVPALHLTSIPMLAQLWAHVPQ
jgi:hypothetical protein